MKATLLFVFQVVTATVLWGQSFVHPGAMNTKKDLDFIKAKIKANAEPWKSAYSSFLTSKAGSYDGINPQPYSSLNYVHRPFASVDCGSYNNPNVGCNDIVYDGMAAYSLALQFFITDDVRYATKAIKIITDWSNTYQKNTESNSRLVVSWATPWFVNAGEILRYTAGSGWTNTETSKLNTLLDKFKTYIFWEDKPANNWMMSSVEARLAIAVFQNDRPAFDAAIVKWKERIKTYIYQTTDGSQPIIPAGGTRSWSDGQWKDNRTAVPNYVNGLCMETCRDISHTKLGVTSLANGAEIAWSQGVDLFSTEKKRFSDFLELHAPWMMGANPPNNICDGYLDIVSEEAFEILYNHLHDRLGVNLPQSKTMLLRNRPNSANRWVTKWETLCYADRSFATPVPNKAPVASFSAPTFTSIDEGYADLYVKVDASDPDGDSISLVLKIDGVEIRTETNPPYEWGHVSTNPTTDVETQGLAAGDHVFEVIVTDNKGALTTIKKTITVNRVNQAPTVSITSPTNGTIFKEGVSHWCKFKLNTKGVNSSLLIEFPDHRLDYIDFYVFDETGIIFQNNTGDQREYKSRLIHHKNFVFSLPKTRNNEITIIYKAMANQNAGFGCILRTVPFFINYSITEYLSLGVFYGILLLIFFLNFAVFAKNRSQSPLFYSLYVLAFALFSMSQDGLLYEFIWPVKWPMYNYTFEVAIFLSVVFQYLYAFDFLELKVRTPKLYIFCLGFLIFRTTIFAYFILYPNANNTTLLYDSITLLPLYFAAIIIYKQGYIPARLFIVGNTFFYLGVGIHALESFGLLDNRSVITVYAAQFGVMIEMLAQTLAFADKLNFEKVQKLEIQRQLISSLHKNEQLQDTLIEELKEKELLKEKVNRELEEKVTERTVELQNSMEQISLQSNQIENMNKALDKAYYDLKKQRKQSLTEKVFRVTSEEDFIEAFTTEQDCLAFLAKIKWNPFCCSKCFGNNNVKGVKPYTRRCTSCNFVDSVTANTILHRTRIPLVKAFKIISHVFHDKKTPLESLALEIDLRKATVYDFAKKVKIKKHKLKKMSLEGVFLNGE